MDLYIIEDALKTYPNRFQLTMMAVARAKELNQGEKPVIERVKGDKPVVQALEEIAAGEIIEGTVEEMELIRRARRQAREKALREMEAAEEAAEDDEAMHVASPDEPSDSA